MAERCLLAVHAHPDDESIATGGVLAQAADRGWRAAVVTCTGGEEGEVVGDGMDPEDVRPRLAEVRRAELAEALDVLGAGPPRLLGYRDSGMMGSASNHHPAAFWRAQLDEAVARLVGHIRSLRPDVVVVYDPFGGYGHPDHIQAHRAALLAVEAAGTAALRPERGPAWRVSRVYQSVLPRGMIAEGARLLRERGLPSPFDDADDATVVPMGVDDVEVDVTVDVRPWLDRKWAALRAHRSQLGPDSFFLNVPVDLRELFFGTEWFARVRDGVPGASPDDLLAGLA